MNLNSLPQHHQRVGKGGKRKGKKDTFSPSLFKLLALDVQKKKRENRGGKKKKLTASSVPLCNRPKFCPPLGASNERGGEEEGKGGGKKGEKRGKSKLLPIA